MDDPWTLAGRAAMQAKRCSVLGRWFASVTQLRWAALLAAVVLLACSGFVPRVSAADNKAQDEKEEIPPPEDLMLRTGDGLGLALTYYPGTKGKETIPIVLLHMWKQNRNDYKELARFLQAVGHAVIMPDLRGHGQSTRLRGARRDETLKAATMSPQQFKAMVTQDMEAVKVFLWDRNNAGELNIDKLCVVGAEMGALVALNFAMTDAVDQDHNRVRRPDYKLGRFVKALVLISPELSFRGLPTRLATAHPVVQSDIAILVLVGEQDNKALEEAKRIHAIFERYHPEPRGDSMTQEEKRDATTLFFFQFATSLQGTKLLDPKFNVAETIAIFVHLRLVKSPESRQWTWRERKVPHR